MKKPSAAPAVPGTATSNSKDEKTAASMDAVAWFKEQFAKEAPHIRERIIQDLPAYNVLLNIKASSFEDLALQVIAKERNMEYDRHHPPVPACPHCGCADSHHKIVKNQRVANVYVCDTCGKSFAANHNSIVSKSKKDLLTWTKFLFCLLQYETISKTTEYCNIAPATYYQMRERICYAMYLFLSNLKLYGHIQADETYIRTSYKGSNLTLSQFDDDDFRFDGSFKPRAKRDRGGAYSYRERNRNHICVFAAVDDHGHSFTCYAGIGVPGIRALRKHVPTDKFLSTVPKTDPFHYGKKNYAEPKTQAGHSSLFITDREQTIRKFGADCLLMKCYSRVFRRGNKQMRTPKKFKEYNIQRVNYIHRRLDEHLRKCGSGNSRYLRGSLLMFDFIQNTGGLNNQAAIDELLRLLVTPTLGQDASVYEAMSSVPNYYAEWQDQEDALAKLSPNVLLGYYLLDRFKHPNNYPDLDKPSQAEIEAMTGLTMPTIRAHYKQLTEKGYHDDIIAMYYSPANSNTDSQDKKRKKLPIGKDFENGLLLAYDEYAKMLAQPAHKWVSLKSIYPSLQEKYHLPYGYSNALLKFQEVEQSGQRAPLPRRSARAKSLNSYNVPAAAFEVLDAYSQILEDFKRSGEPYPKQAIINNMLSEKFPQYSVFSLTVYLNKARAYVREYGHPDGEDVCALDLFEIKEAAVCHIFDLLVEYRKTHFADTDAEDLYLKELLSQHNLDMTVKSLRTRFSKLVSTGTRPALPHPIVKPKGSEPSIPPKAFEVYAAYQQIINEHLGKGMQPPTNKQIYAEIKRTRQPELGESTMRAYMSLVRAFMREQESLDEGTNIQQE